MPTIIIDNREVECREGISVLQAALEAGIDVPHYCYHPGLSVVASCRLCLMEMKVSHPTTHEMEWAPKLIPSCQTTVRDSMEVRFDSPAVKENQKRVMEYYLVNHPLDCPVCDQAGECYLQDYSQRFGEPNSRVVDAKHKNPKKDIGSRTLLYQDRCVMCTRCVRFTEEVAGTQELCIVNRGDRAEIDVFPGRGLENNLQGNVVDICPVGSLLDKDFLFEQRVWFLKGVDSICPGCSTGCAIRADVNDGRLWRLKPRYNPGVNDWWMCDEGRFGWKYVHDEMRITRPRVRRGTAIEQPSWESIPTIVQQRFADMVAKYGPASVAVQLSPEMSCEEAWLLARFIRGMAAEATLTLGDVHSVGEPQLFPVSGVAGGETFVVQPEKHPNRRGVEMILDGLGGAMASREDVWSKIGKGEIKAFWLVGGYPRADWAKKELSAATEKLELFVIQDMFPSKVTETAHVVLPFCAWVEREGTFVNQAGLVQAFKRALPPPESARIDGQYLFAIAGYEGLYTGERVREMMVSQIPGLGQIHIPPPQPAHQH